MGFETRLIKFIRNLRIRAVRRLKFLRNYFPYTILFFLTGFYGGNLFAGTVLQYARSFLHLQDGGTAIVLLAILEIFNSYFYRISIYQRTAVMQFTQYVKLGLLFGLFVDAFKVGS
jgi:hypothetical protein